VLLLSGILAWHALRPKGLARALLDASIRQHARVFYAEDSSPWNILVNGDGRVLVQKDGTATTDGLWPTCTSTVPQTEIEQLLRLMVTKNLELLPRKGFPMYVGPVEAFPRKLHIIAVDAGPTRGTWVFETGQMNGRVESIPPDFGAVEADLRELRQKAIPVDGSSCPLAPGFQGF